MGVPLIRPEVVSKERPLGREVEIAKVSGAVPPEAVTGVEETANPTVKLIAELGSDVVKAWLIVRSKEALAVAPLLSVMVTVNEEIAKEEVAAPEITPVEGAIDSPLGRAGEIV